MAKLYKVEMYILDPNDYYSCFDNIIADCENATDIYFRCFNEQEAEVEWDDGINLNQRDCTLESHRNYFKKVGK